MKFTKISDLHKIIHAHDDKKKLVLCAAGDEHSLEAVLEAYKDGIITPILVGLKTEIDETVSEYNFDISGIEVHYERDLASVVRKSVSLVINEDADILMKGHISTAQLLSGVLNKEYGLKTKRFLSHLAIFDIPEYHKPLAITDVAMNINPDLKQKTAIINNAVNFLGKIGLENPKIAALAAVENVNDKMQATMDAALLSIMQRRGQIKNCIIDGPLAFDNAISFESKKTKGLEGPVAGDADMLLVPDIEAGNMLYKAFVFFANAEVCGVVLGAPFPIVLTSRADSEQTKYNSILLAAASTSKF